MKRYIRTKDAKIIDTKLEVENVIKNHNERCSYFRRVASYKFRNYLGYLECYGYDKNGKKIPDLILFDLDLEDIEKQADTIDDLIMDGDLVHDSECDEMFFIDNYTIFDYGAFDELYTKQGNNYILVARKENGEWRVI